MSAVPGATHIGIKLIAALLADAAGVEGGGKPLARASADPPSLTQLTLWFPPPLAQRRPDPGMPCGIVRAKESECLRGGDEGFTHHTQPDPVAPVGGGPSHSSS